MNREKAIEIFKRLKENAPNEMHLETVGSAQELFDMAIQSLSQEATDIVSRGARAFNIAVGQLKELGYGLGQKIEPCDDAVSRQAVINAIENDCMKGGLGSCFACYNDAQAFRGEIEKLPSVTHKSGKWIEDAKTYYEELNKRGLGVDEYTPYFTDDIACSECLAKYNTIDNETQFFKFCPNCGAYMVEPQESEDKE